MEYWTWGWGEGLWALSGSRPFPCPQIPCRDVGMPNHIKVWHDNSGRGPDWFLEWIRIRKKGQINWTIFPCQRWFSTHLDDCRISRILFAGHATPVIQYKVSANTHAALGWACYLVLHVAVKGAQLETSAGARVEAV